MLQMYQASGSIWTPRWDKYQGLRCLRIRPPGIPGNETNRLWTQTRRSALTFPWADRDRYVIRANSGDLTYSSRTSPVSPSTSIVRPSAMMAVAMPVTTTAGMSVLPGDDGVVAESPAGVRYDPARRGEQGRPRR
jgi:hypothetical protein